MKANSTNRYFVPDAEVISRVLFSISLSHFADTKIIQKYDLCNSFILYLIIKSYCFSMIFRILIIPLHFNLSAG